MWASVQSLHEKAQHMICCRTDSTNVLSPVRSAVYNNIKTQTCHPWCTDNGLCFGSICDQNNVALLYVKHHTPGLTPLKELIEVFLQEVAV